MDEENIIEEKETKTRFLTPTRGVILAVVVLSGLVLGRIVVRAALNLLLGGTLFGGDFL